MKKKKKSAVAKPSTRRTVRTPVKKTPAAKPAKKPAKTPRKTAAKKAPARPVKKAVRKISAAKVVKAAAPEISPPLKVALRRSKTAPAPAPEPAPKEKAPIRPLAVRKRPEIDKAAPKLAKRVLERVTPIVTPVVSPVKIVARAKRKIEPVAEAIAKLEPKPAPAPAPLPVIAPAPAPAKRPVKKALVATEVKPLSQETIQSPPKPPAKVKPVTKPKSAPASKPPEVTALPVKSVTPLVAQTISLKPAVEGKPAARPTPVNIPSILFEGDHPETTRVSGPGQRYALGPTAPVEKLETEGELPASYGTGSILLTARDPHWLYTHWDLTGDQQRRYNAFSRDGHLVVRVYDEATRGKHVAQVQVHPESRHWFVHVERANTRYYAELGYYNAAERWTVVSTSTATLTPPDAVSADTTADFGTIPFEVPMAKLLSLVKEAVQEHAPLAQALQELRANGHGELPVIEVPPTTTDFAPTQPGEKPPRRPWTPSTWTVAQEHALAEVVSMDQVRRVWMGSLEITELIRRKFLHELSSMTAAELGALPAGAPTSPTGGVSSPSPKPGRQEKGFWFNVNAELIVYGATEPDATVSIGGRKIKLRPDGSFSYRFALPDGNYEMPVVAISADETDGRAAELKFSRATEYRGDVGAHPQDPSLQQMNLDNF